jgi:hypothetical protein
MMTFEAPSSSRKPKRLLVECRILLRKTNDINFRYVQTQRRARPPIVDEGITVRDIDGAKIFGTVQKLCAIEGFERLRYDVHVEAHSLVMVKPPRAGRRAKRRTYSGRCASR